MHGDPELGPKVSSEAFCMITSVQLAPNMAEIRPELFSCGGDIGVVCEHGVRTASSSRRKRKKIGVCAAAAAFLGALLGRGQSE